MWLATDKDGTRWAFKKKPERGKAEWKSDGESAIIGIFPLDEVPSFVEQQQWKDAPLQVKFEMKKK